PHSLPRRARRPRQRLLPRPRARSLAPRHQLRRRRAERPQAAGHALMAASGDKTRPPAGGAAADNRDAQTGRAAAPNLLPSLSLPKGGGALSGIGEKFTTNPATGTASLTVPIATSPGRLGFNVALHLAYDSGSGNGPFGIGWQLSVGSISRKTGKGLPRYADAGPDDGQPDVVTL